jgi:hypothetical protein
MNYQLCRNIFTGEIDPNSIYLIDDGSITWVPSESRLWADYQAWLFLGNTPLPAA